MTTDDTVSVSSSIQDPRRHLALEALKRFRVLFKSASNPYESAEQCAGLTGAQLWALAEVAQADNLTVNGLAEAMAVHQSTASNLIDKLDHKGLVLRLRDPYDRRVVRLRPTPSGQAVLASAPGPAAGILPDALLRLAPEKLEQLNELLNELAHLLHPASGEASQLSR
ncbi:MarR family winged helix-turn-helix transcriptional regulator [Chitinimonas lacunae]|uniref:MarR family winged helix-turn-helix transcriptional regulator n=1 Tax=Chitinimonas lacunae TaxID=1963018 RepID=A0ABV8MW54_9NEIS